MAKILYHAILGVLFVVVRERSRCSSNGSGQRARARDEREREGVSGTQHQCQRERKGAREQQTECITSAVLLLAVVYCVLPTWAFLDVGIPVLRTADVGIPFTNSFLGRTCARRLTQMRTHAHTRTMQIRLIFRIPTF